MNHIEVRINKHDMMVFDDMAQCNAFIDSFTLEYKENIMFSAPNDRHLDFIESTIFFYDPVLKQPKGQEALQLDIQIPKSLD